MVKVENIIKTIMKQLNTLYPTYKIYIGNLEEKASYPCFLLYLGLETNKVTDTELIKKTLMVDIVYFNSNLEKDVNNYIAKIKVRDNMEENLLNKTYITVDEDNVKMDYSTTNADDLLNITLKLTYFNNIIKENLDYELIQELLLNTKIN
ncbi:hypothetical protein DP124_12035 [Clostridium tetani]|uniref:phage tail terminator family protein n=1 Tax=Clostridium tetani TaxID=1513 RepID=UPI00100AFDFF|nr:hypothetical protein [Clostridium tetani]RXI50192.1 hypothetical protein DP124_12035 [Clostridium tetani]